MKVYVNEGEYINLGASHVGVAGGFIKVYRPDGTLKITYNGSNAPTAIINNNTQEAAGPTGGAGYVPGVIQAGAGEAGTWTVIFDFPDYTNAAFTNLMNVNYEWFFNNGTCETSLGTTNLPTFFIENASQTNTGVYTVSVTKNGCQLQRSNAQDIVVETPQVIAATNTTDASTPACEGDAVQLSAPLLMGPLTNGSGHQISIPLCPIRS